MEGYKNFMKDWDYSKPVESRKKFQKHLKEARDDKNKEIENEIQTQIARTHGLELEFDQAHSILNEVEKQLDTLTSAKVHIRYYLERGRTYNSNKELEKAKECFMNAIKLAKENKEENLEVDALHMMGIAEKEPEKQIEWNKKAIKIAENSNNEKTQKWLGPLLNNTGWSLFDQQKYENALELFKKSLDFRKNQKEKNTIAIAMWCIARTQRALENNEGALKMQLEIKKYREENKLEKGGYNYEELGELYLQKEMKEEAKENFKEAYALLSQDKWLVKNEKERLERIKKLANL